MFFYDNKTHAKVVLNLLNTKKGTFLTGVRGYYGINQNNRVDFSSMPWGEEITLEIAGNLLCEKEIKELYQIY